jgi:hypothetical protein
MENSLKQVLEEDGGTEECEEMFDLVNTIYSISITEIIK